MFVLAHCNAINQSVRLPFFRLQSEVVSSRGIKNVEDVVDVVVGGVGGSTSKKKIFIAETGFILFAHIHIYMHLQVVQEKVKKIITLFDTKIRLNSYFCTSTKR